MKMRMEGETLLSKEMFSSNKKTQILRRKKTNRNRKGGSYSLPGTLRKTLSSNQIPPKTKTKRKIRNNSLSKFSKK
jgi:hypothetical protein